MPAFPSLSMLLFQGFVRITMITVSFHHLQVSTAAQRSYHYPGDVAWLPAEAAVHQHPLSSSHPAGSLPRAQSPHSHQAESCVCSLPAVMLQVQARQGSILTLAAGSSCGAG